ncbi:MAG: hypothetical protein K2G63_01255 [Oscillospiraceae bacterium]|nr:hypothetical protein [Oscillospiraceae bacterium]
MTLLIAVISAVISTIIWYVKAPDDIMKVSSLCFIYWGASLMWLVDAVFEYAELRDEFFYPSLQDMLNDTFLGVSAVVLGFVLWVIELLISDPKGVIKNIIQNKKSEEN